MKHIYFLTITLLLLSSVNAQTTAIPDANFEQALINLGLDVAPLDGTVLTANIDTLTSLIVNAQSISNLTGIEDFIALTYLDCQSNQLTSLDVTNNTALISLNFYQNQLTSIDLTNNTALWSLYCSYNQLTNLDVTNNTALVYLTCDVNPINNLDVTNNIALISLACSKIQLTNLDVTQNTSLKILYCIDNQLTSLDITKNTALTSFKCVKNQLHCLNVKNGNNNNFISFMANNNPNLTCIEVDNTAYSTSNWTLVNLNFNVDPSVSFSTNCNNDCSPVGIDEQNKNVVTNVYPNPTSKTVNIEVTENNLSYQLIDVTGKVIQQERLSKNENNINVSTIPNGFYTLSVYNTQGIVTTEKLIVAH